MHSTVYHTIQKAYQEKRTLLYVLIDPDKVDASALPDFILDADVSGVDGFFIGGSLSLVAKLDEWIRLIKQGTKKPVIIFPGGVHHISAYADAILFLSLISGRNADQLIGQHVIAAPIVKHMGLEAISTGYMLIESGRTTTAEYMSYSKPIPRNKPDIAVAHAMAAEYLGMKIVYLEAGSGADESVPDEMIARVAESIDIPIIVGGGIRTPQIARQKVRAGATVIVVGNHFEDSNNHIQLQSFAGAVHAGIAELSLTI